jgi:hypothetical protein
MPGVRWTITVATSLALRSGYESVSGVGLVSASTNLRTVSKRLSAFFSSALWMALYTYLGMPG